MVLSTGSIMNPLAASLKAARKVEGVGWGAWREVTFRLNARLRGIAIINSSLATSTGLYLS